MTEAVLEGALLSAYHLRSRGSIACPDSSVRMKYSDGRQRVLVVAQPPAMVARVYRDGVKIAEMSSLDPPERRLEDILRHATSESMLFSNMLGLDILSPPRVLKAIADARPVRVDVAGGAPVDLWIRTDGALLCAAILIGDRAVSYRPLTYERPVRVAVPNGAPVDLWIRPDGSLLCAAVILGDRAVSYRPLNMERVSVARSLCTAWSRNDGAVIEVEEISYDAALATAEMPGAR